MQVKCEIVCREIIPSCPVKTLKMMNNKVEAFSEIYERHKYMRRDLHVILVPEFGLTINFECHLSKASDIFREFEEAIVK